MLRAAPQAIDLLDEAGSRVRIAAYTARKGMLASALAEGEGTDVAPAATQGAAAEREALAASSYLELEQGIATKDEAVQVGVGGAWVGVGVR